MHKMTVFNKNFSISKKVNRWSGCWDSNPGPLGPKPSAIPTSPHPDELNNQVFQFPNLPATKQNTKLEVIYREIDK